MKSLKKMLAVVLAASLTLSSAVVAFGATSPTTGAVATENKTAVDATDVPAQVTTTAKGEATISKFTDKKATKATIDTVTVNGVEYKVTEIKANAFKGTKVKTVSLGENVAKVGKNAFSGAKSLKTVTLANKKVTVSSKAFSGLSKSAKAKITIKVNSKISKKDYAKLVKALKKAGISEKRIKKVKIK